MLNFPDAPTIGQVYTSGGLSWSWDGVKWVVATTVVTSVAPMGIPVLPDDPGAGPGADKAWLYAVDNGNGTVDVRTQAGTSAVGYDIIVSVGGGV